jgi:hypothetical protein
VKELVLVAAAVQKRFVGEKQESFLALGFVLELDESQSASSSPKEKERGRC